MTARVSRPFVSMTIKVVPLKNHLLYRPRKPEGEQRFPVHRGKEESHTVHEHRALDGARPSGTLLAELGQVCEELHGVAWEGVIEIRAQAVGRPSVHVFLSLFDNTVRSNLESLLTRLISLVCQLKTSGVVEYRLTLSQRLLPFSRGVNPVILTLC